MKSDSKGELVMDRTGGGRLTFSLLLLFILPSLLFVSLKLSSLAPGLLLSCLAILVVNWRSLLRFRFSKANALSFVAIFIVTLIFGVLVLLSVGESKSLISLSIFLVAAVAFVQGQAIFSIDANICNRVLRNLLVLLILLGWMKLAWQPSILGYDAFSKPVFPFSEESHYSLFLGIIACGVIVNAGAALGLFVIGNMLSLAILMPNLTLLVFVCMSCLLLLLRIRLLFFWLGLSFALIVIGLFFYFVLLEHEYFRSRLDFSGSNNLTAMVFLQGWGLAYSNLVGTSGLGLGFQMLGSDGTFLPKISEAIYRHAGQYFNVADGGFLAAKIIAELGVIGLALSVWYLFLLLSTIFSINYWVREARRLEGTERLLAKKFVMAGGLVFGFSVEFFLRGLGYFSPGVFLFFVAVTVYFKSKALLRQVL